MRLIEEANPDYESCADCVHSDDSEEICILRRCIHAVSRLKECYVPKSPTIEPSAQPTLYGYPVEHLAMIAMVLQKENLPPERVAEMLSDVGRIVEMARDEFEEKLRKAVEGGETNGM